MLLGILMLSWQIVVGQSADNIKNYVLFDISGSASELDSNMKRFLLLFEFLKINEQKNSDFEKSDIEFYFFGSDSVFLNNQRLKTFYNNELIKSISNLNPNLIQLKLKELINEVKNDSKAFNRLDNRTNLFFAYSDLLDVISDSNTPNQSQAIYIFTDGVLLPGDISRNKDNPDETVTDSLQKIIAYKLRKLIKDQNTTGTPTFLIQTSTTSANNYFSFTNSEYLGNDTQNLGLKNRFGFWINSAPSTQNNDLIISEFQSFFSKSRQTIIERSLKENETNLVQIIEGKLNHFGGIITPLNSQLTTANYYIEGSKGSGPNFEYFTDRIGSKKLFINTSVNISEGSFIESIFENYLNKKYILVDIEKAQSYAELNSTELCENVNNLDKELCSYLIKGIKHIYELNFESTIDNSQIDTISNWVNTLQSNNDLKNKIDSLYTEHLKSDNSNTSYKLFETFTVFESNNLLTPLSLSVEEMRKSESLEEAIILGLRDYIIKRTRQELFSIYYQDIHSDIFDKNSFLSDTLFYNFSSLIERTETQAPSILQVRRAIENDLDLLLENLVLTPQVKENEELLLVAFTTTLIEEFIKEKNILLAFNELSKLTEDSIYTNESVQQLTNSFKFISRLLKEYEEYDMHNYYENMSNNFQQIGIKLLAVSLADTLQLNTSIQLKNIYNNIFDFYEEFERVKNHIIKLSEEIQAIQPNQDFEEYQRYKRNAVIDMISDIISLLSQGITLYADLSNESDIVKKKAYTFERHINSILDIYFTLQDGYYVNALTMIYPLIPESLYSNPDSSDNKIESEKIFNLISFTSEVATAQNSTDIVNVLDRYALPLSSFRLKKKGDKPKFYVNSYSFFNISTRKDTSYTYPSISLPVGLEIAFPVWSNKRTNISFFAPILDLGNTINFDPDSNNDEILNFDRVLSPGLHIVGSFSKRYPVSFSTGYQLRPNRMVFNLGLDIPLFRLGN